MLRLLGYVDTLLTVLRLDLESGQQIIRNNYNLPHGEKFLIMGGKLSKNLTCYQVKVIGCRSVIAKMKLSILEDGYEVANSKFSSVYNRTSNWSQADPLVQRICQVVFSEPEQPNYYLGNIETGDEG